MKKAAWSSVEAFTVDIVSVASEDPLPGAKPLTANSFAQFRRGRRQSAFAGPPALVTRVSMIGKLRAKRIPFGTQLRASLESAVLTTASVGVLESTFGNRPQIITQGERREM